MILYYINDDCFDYMKSIPQGSINVVLSDIPYGIDFNSKNVPDTDWDKFTDDDYEKFLKLFFEETYKITDENGILIIFCAPTKVEQILNVNDKWIFNPKYYYHYGRIKGRGSKHKLKSQREDIIVFSKKELNIDETNINNFYKERLQKDLPLCNVVDYIDGKRVPVYNMIGETMYVTQPSHVSVSEKLIHSCQKPITLIVDLLYRFTKKGQTILDPFMGSGATGIASFLCERNYIGIEIDKDMYKKANDWKDLILDSKSKQSQILSQSLNLKKVFWKKS